METTNSSSSGREEEELEPYVDIFLYFGTITNNEGDSIGSVPRFHVIVIVLAFYFQPNKKLVRNQI